jgi:phosphoribosylglycinamide formyltransferase-1
VSEPVPEKKLRVGVLVSGRGSNLQALLDASATGNLPAEIVLVGCNHAGAQALDRAAFARVPVCLADRAEIKSRAVRQARLLEALVAADVDLVVLAGFDEILVPDLTARYAGRIVNTHPSLLPAFGGGMHAIEQALDYGVKITGCTVHLVTDELDAGPILMQGCVEVRDGDTADTLGERVRATEHVVLVAAVKALAEGRVRVQDGRATVVASATS